MAKRDSTLLFTQSTPPSFTQFFSSRVCPASNWLAVQPLATSMIWISLFATAAETAVGVAIVALCLKSLSSKSCGFAEPAIGVFGETGSFGLDPSFGMSAVSLSLSTPAGIAFSSVAASDFAESISPCRVQLLHESVHLFVEPRRAGGLPKQLFRRERRCRRLASAHAVRHDHEHYLIDAAALGKTL